MRAGQPRTLGARGGQQPRGDAVITTSSHTLYFPPSQSLSPSLPQWTSFPSHIRSTQPSPRMKTAQQTSSQRPLMTDSTTTTTPPSYHHHPHHTITGSPPSPSPSPQSRVTVISPPHISPPVPIPTIYHQHLPTPPYFPPLVPPSYHKYSPTPILSSLTSVLFLPTILPVFPMPSPSPSRPPSSNARCSPPKN